MTIEQDVTSIKTEVKTDVQAAKDYYAAQELKADTFLDDLKNLKVTALILFAAGVVVTAAAIKVLFL